MGRYTVHTVNGPKQKTVYGRTRAEAAEKLTKAMADRDCGLIFQAGTVTLGQYMERWLEDSVRDTVRQRTYERYEQVFRVHIRPALGQVKLMVLTSAHIRGLIRQKLDAGLSGSSVRQVHVTLNKALKQAVDDCLVPRNVAASVKAPRLRREEVRPLEREQVRALFEAARGERLEALYTLAVTAGLRRGELLGLKWEDLDLEAGTLEVRRSLSDARSGRAFIPPKSGKGRQIRLARSATTALRSHRKRQTEQRLRAGATWRDHGLVFATTVGTPLDAPNIVNRHFKPLLKRSGLPDIRWHDLRHTYATLLLAKGVHPKYVQTSLGHASI